MPYRWSDLKAKITRALDDTARAETETPTWSNDELLDYINYALVAFADHTAQAKTYEYKATAAVSTVVLPEDFLKIGPVWFPNRRLIKPIRLEPGLLFSSTTVTTSSLPIGFYEWPEGTLNLTRELGGGETLTVYYWAHWDEVVGDDSLLSVPVWAREALHWYCLSRAMAKPGIQAAQLGQWKTRRDLGEPESNPAKAFAKYCEEKYEEVLSRHPSQDRSGWESQVT